MRSLSDTLLAAQKSPTSTPYVKVEIRNNIGLVTRLDWERLYEGSEDDYHHALTISGDGSLIRARIVLFEFQGILYRQRVVNPDPDSDFSQWTQIANVCSATGTALTSNGANVIHFWVDTDHLTIRYQESSDNGASWGSIQNLLAETEPIYYLAAAMKSNNDICLLYSRSSILYAIKREAGSWGSATSWTNSLQSINGIAIDYLGDWDIVITGRDENNYYGVWQCVYGDGFSASIGTWTTLKELSK